MIVILNKEKADYKNNYEGSIQDILIYFSTKIKYQSIEVAKENLASLIELFVEAFTDEKPSVKEESERKKITNLIRRLNNFHKYLEKYNSIDKLSAAIFNFILSMSGNSLLNGFGFANSFGDSLRGNAETRSLYQL